MIIWFFGNSGAGKTSEAEKFIRNVVSMDGNQKPVLLDGDSMRDTISRELDMQKPGRWAANMRVARLAKLLESQGFDVIVALICPYEDLRTEVHRVCSCHFIYVTGGKCGKDYPFEEPEQEEIGDLSIGVVKGNEDLREEYRKQSLSEN